MTDAGTSGGATAMRIDFAESARSSLGVEWELALVDAGSRELVPVAESVLRELASADPLAGVVGPRPQVTGELLLNTVELVTGVCRTVPEATAELEALRDRVLAVTGPRGVRLFGAGTHPFSATTAQPVTDRERYAVLMDRTQWWGRQMVIYGLHVHVGVDHRDKALPVLDGLVNHVPHLQALSASSPFWAGEDTGYASQRALMFQQLPTAGLPFQFSTWEQYEGYVRDVLTTGVIDELNEIRWDIRPAPQLGTVEMRVCDGLPTVEEVGAVAALTQCLVDDFAATLDDGGTIPTMPPWHVQENKWRAARYGLDAIIITDAACTERPVTEDLSDLLNRLEPTARRLGCADELAGVEDMVRRGGSYRRQRAVAAANDGDLRAVVDDLVELTAHGHRDWGLSPGAPAAEPPAARPAGGCGPRAGPAR